MKGRAVRLAGATLLVAAIAGPLTSGPAEGDALARYSLSAAADAVGIGVTASGAPLAPDGKLAFITPATAQASLSALGDFGESEAYAAAPNPGDFIVSLPTTVNGVGAGSLPPFPGYPFSVKSDSTQGSRRESFGPYSISATSEPHTSTAEARVGLSTTTPDVAAVTARATVAGNPDTEVLKAESVSAIAPFAIAQLVRIGDIRSSVTLTYDPARPEAGVRKESTFSVGTITVAGAEFGLTEDGLTAAGQPVAPVDPAQATSFLREHGVAIEYLPGSQTDTALTSAAVRITLRGKIPLAQDSTLELVLGRASATAVPVLRQVPIEEPSAPGLDGTLTGDVPPAGGAVVAPDAPGGGGSGTAGGSTSPGLGFGGPSGAGGAVAPGGSGAVPGSANGDVTVGPPGATASGQASAPALVRGHRPAPLTNPEAVYLAVAIAAIAVAGGSRLTTWLAARSG